MLANAGVVMKELTIMVKEGVSSQQQESLLEAIASWPDVKVAQSLAPESRNEKARRMAFAHLTDESDSVEVIKRMAALDEIESASVPPQR